MDITKIFKFEMAHKLDKSYTEKCQHIHGHSYVVEVVLTGLLNDEAVVMDFTQLKEIAKPLIDTWDHALMIHESDYAKDTLLKLSDDHDLRLILCSTNPTAETLAAYIFNFLDTEIRKVNKAVLVKSVKIHETCTGSATCTELSEACTMRYFGKCKGVLK